MGLKGVSTVEGAVYNPGAVAITGGSIDGTTIGGTTPAPATFSKLTLSGNIAVSGSTNFDPAAAKLYGPVVVMRFWNFIEGK